MVDLLTCAQAMQGEMAAWRRHIHANPEIGEELPETTLFVTAKLREFGCEPKEICKCCVVAEIQGTRPGKCILLRADMDALPIKEMTELPFKSVNGYMHACGHDIHTAMMLAVSRLLMENRDQFAGTVKVVFQPGEEVLLGSAHMIEAGVLENPKVDAALTMHVDSLSNYSVGSVTLVDPGAILSSCDLYRIEITGKGCHGASPEQGTDPINVGAHIHLALQELLSREAGARNVAVLTQGIFHAGDAANIIPQTAYMEGTLRTFDEALRKKLLKRMEEICVYTARAFGAEASLIHEGGCASFINNPELFEEIQAFLRDFLGGYYVHEGPAGVYVASEDFSNVSQMVPTLQLTLVTGSADAENAFPMHHPQVVFDESPMYRGAAAMAGCAMHYLQQHSK